MRQKSQIVAPKTRQLERIFDEFLLFIFSLFLVSYLSLFLLLGNGIKLLLDEPEENIQSLNWEKTQKSKVGFLLKDGNFEATFNEKALSDFSFLDQERKEMPEPAPQRLPFLEEPHFYEAQLIDLSESQNSNAILGDKNPLKNLKVRLKKDLIEMILPLTLGETKKTVIIEESLKAEDKRLVSDIKTVQIGKLPIPGYVATYLLDSFSSNLMNLVWQKIETREANKGEKLKTSINPRKFRLSKMIMPPALLLLFGPKDFMQTLLKENREEKQYLENIPTFEVSGVKIEEGKITIKGKIEGLERLNIPENFNPLEMFKKLTEENPRN